MTSLACLVFTALAVGACGHRVEDQSKRSEVGSVFSGRYELLALVAAHGMPDKFRGFGRVGSDPLGAGSFGEAWLARDLSTSQEVVLKFFISTNNGVKTYLNPINAPSLGEQAVDSLQDARTECQIPENISSQTSASPNYVSRCLVNGVDDEERSFLVLEKAGTTTLKEYMKSFHERRPTVAEKLRVYTSVAKMLLEGLAQFEGYYVHRDIKLENVMVSEGDEGEPTGLKIIDWGLAVPEGFEGQVAGNRAHLPPETIKNKDSVWGLTADPFVFTSRYDVYAAGETLYSFVCTTTLETMRRLTYDKVMGGLNLKSPHPKINRRLAMLSPSKYGTPGCREIPSALEPLLKVIEAATRNRVESEYKNLVRPLASELLTEFASVLAQPGSQE